MDERLIRQIYLRLGDKVSRDIFSKRLLYSITQDQEYICKMVMSIPEGQMFYEKLDYASKQGGIVIFGAGVWGQDLYKMTYDYPWKSFIDSNPNREEFEGIPVVNFSEFINNYNNETVVISSRLYYKEMYTQLLQSGISPHKILNAGSILDNLSKKQYFDLEELKLDKEETFVDAGSFDGMTSVYFNELCKGTDEDIKVKVFAFEPDDKNAEKCHTNLVTHNIQHNIIKKGLWNEEKVLHFKMVANGSSTVNADGEDHIEVTTLDKAMDGEKVTFIKMDIEGSELNALMGANNIIIKNKPKMAISIYHKPEDIWEIPKIILEYNPDYRLYLRHYSLTDYETVLYAIN